MLFRRLLTLVVLLSLTALARADEPAEFFEKRVRPILVTNCFPCHSQQTKKKGGLHLDSRAAILKGGDSGQVIVAGEPAKSRLIAAVEYKDIELQMPPKGKLPDSAIADLTAWVKMGVPWPGPATTQAPAEKIVFDLEKRKRSHWAWQLVKASTPPAVRDASWPAGAADRFILAKLEAKGIRPAPTADKRTWLRRVTFDVTGLPPTVAEIDAFLKDDSPQAFARAVDRLLDSPHFGEHWARHWLDLVRYAESRGHEFDPSIPNVWQYRDYVIRALNADLPYNQFVTEHLAGDLLAKPRLHPDGGNESILGTGFWFLGEESHSPVDIRGDEADRLDNRLDVLTKTFLALTVSCARCHDHKFDAISTKDYYALLGFMESSNYRQVRFDAWEQNRRVAAELAEVRAKLHVKLQRALAESLHAGAAKMPDYLLAARDVIQGGMLPPKAAARRNVETARVEQWVRFLREAGSADDLFQPWRAACGFAGNVNAPPAHPTSETIVDYLKLRPEEWVPDDVTFALRQLGEIRINGSVEKPQVSFVERAAAEKDSAWNKLTDAPGTQLDHGALGTWVRSGRTIRTPAFTLKPGKTYILANGKGKVYAAVDSHTIIAGPLHGRLVSAFDTGGNWQWIACDLSNYAGHRAHLEISWLDDADLAVAQVVQSKRPRRSSRLPPPRCWPPRTEPCSLT